MGNKAKILTLLRRLGLSPDQAKVFESILKSPKNQLEISRDTGIARSSVYRIVDELTDKSLIHELTTDNDKLIEAANIQSLELIVIEEEKALQQKKSSLNELTNLLQNITNSEDSFAIKTYKGVDGLKQMLWNELDSKGEIVMFSCGSLNSATGKFFADKFREAVIRRAIPQRALENDDTSVPTFKDAPKYMEYYKVRYISRDILTIKPEITIHEDTISIYNNWESDVYLGTEIKNPFLAVFMRQVFESFWQLAKQ